MIPRRYRLRRIWKHLSVQNRLEYAQSCCRRGKTMYQAQLTAYGLAGQTARQTTGAL